MKKWLPHILTLLLFLYACGVRSDHLVLKNVGDENYNKTHNYITVPKQVVFGKIILYSRNGDPSSTHGVEDYFQVGVTSGNFLKTNQTVNGLDEETMDILFKIQDELNDALLTTKNTNPKDEATIIQNNVDIIWADMTSSNTGWASNMPSSYKQFQGPLLKSIKERENTSVNQQNFWFEIEEAGDGSSCSTTINKATNTIVEIGWTRFYFLMDDDTWVLANETKDQLTNGNGGAHPHARSQPLFGFGKERCNTSTDYFHNIQIANKGVVIMDRKKGKFTKAKPQNYYRYHGWANQVNINLTKVKGIFGYTYMRLIIENPALPDDRDLANYVAHVGSDSWMKGGTPYYRGGNGVSRYKKITNNWLPINFLSGLTKAQLEENPPPTTLFD